MPDRDCTGCSMGSQGLDLAVRQCCLKKHGKSNKSQFELQLMVGQTQNKQLTPGWKAHLN